MLTPMIAPWAIGVVAYINGLTMPDINNRELIEMIQQNGGRVESVITSINQKRKSSRADTIAGL
jgi:hypothetical protein